jgi:hypothetical protein
MEVMGDQDAFSAAPPVSASAFSLPGVPACPLIHRTWADRPSSIINQATVLWVSLARLRPGPAPEWFTLAIALVESEWMIMYVPVPAGLVPSQGRTDGLDFGIVRGLS